MFITAHGFDFEVDVNDWSDTKSAEECVSRLDAWLSAQTAKDVQAIHNHFKTPEHWELDEPPAAERCSTEMGRIWLDVTSDWYRRPDGGHNFELTGV